MGFGSNSGAKQAWHHGRQIKFLGSQFGDITSGVIKEQDLYTSFQEKILRENDTLKTRLDKRRITQEEFNQNWSDPAKNPYERALGLNTLVATREKQVQQLMAEMARRQQEAERRERAYQERGFLGSVERAQGLEPGALRYDNPDDLAAGGVVRTGGASGKGGSEDAAMEAEFAKMDAFNKKYAASGGQVVTDAEGNAYTTKEYQARVEARVAAGTATKTEVDTLRSLRNVPGPGYYQAGNKTKEAGFFLRNPSTTWEIGIADSNDNDISSVASRFAVMGESPSSKGSLLYIRRGSDDVAGMGDEVNAFRHALWQATIANRYDNSVAAQVGNAHEDNPWALSSNQTTFSSLKEADQTIDLQNNRIGRAVGLSLPRDTGMATIANAVLDTYYNNGLWTGSQNTSSNWAASQTKLTQDKYDAMKRALMFKNDFGAWVDVQP